MTFDVRLYFSGSVDEPVNRYILQWPGSHRLSTYAYPKEAHEYLTLAHEMGVATRMIIDSGAFTSWSVGKPVQLKQLIDYQDELLRTYGPDGHEWLFISLDVIPGSKGRKPTSEELAKGIDESKQNFLALQQHHAGKPVQVLPVYHTGEDFGLRNWYLERTDYICLSMDQAMSERDRLAWAKRATVPGFKHHGLAATGNRMVTEVDWYSVDSSSWVTVAAMGSILWPTSDGRFRVLAVSETSPSRHDAGNHIDNISQAEREAAEAFIRAKGFDPSTIRNHYVPRWAWNVRMWMETPWRRNIQNPIDLFSEIA